MKALFSLAVQSAWNRRFVLSLVMLSIALSTFLLPGIERRFSAAPSMHNRSQPPPKTDSSASGGVFGVPWRKKKGL